MTDIYIPCLDVPGNTISVGVYKPQGRPAYISAMEGRYTEGRDGGFSSFETELFGKDRSHRVMLTGNNTAKNRAVALAKMLADLKAMGWIAQDATA